MMTSCPARSDSTAAVVASGEGAKVLTGLTPNPSPDSTVAEEGNFEVRRSCLKIFAFFAFSAFNTVIRLTRVLVA